jgi:membrane protease YdiL (CAAX protease family)
MMLASSISSFLDSPDVSMSPTSFFWVIVAMYAVFVIFGMIAGATVFYRFISGKIKLENAKEWLNDIPWTFKNSLLIFGILIAVQIVFILSLRLLYRYHILSVSGEVMALLTSLHGIIFHIFAICLIYFFCRSRQWKWKEVFGLSNQNFITNAGRAIFVYAISLPCVIGLTMIVNLFMLLHGEEVSLQEVIFVFSTPVSLWNLIFLVLLVVVFAPIAEEMLFRGILMPLLAKKIGVASSALVTSLIFAAIHMHMPSILPLFALALALSISYIYWRSLLVPICIHAIFNLISTSLVLSSNLLPK